MLRLEVLMRFNAVSRNAENYSVDRNKLFVQVAELLCLGRAARCAVLGVEVDDDNLSGLSRKIETLPTCSRQGEIGNFGVQHAFAPCLCL